MIPILISAIIVAAVAVFIIFNRNTDTLPTSQDPEMECDEYIPEYTEADAWEYIKEYTEEYDKERSEPTYHTPNEIPPIITGVENLTIRRFGTLLLRQNVAAYDVFGNQLEFFVDSQNVDVDTPGIYSIIYYTYDRYGNRTEVTAYVTVTDVDIDWVYSRVDEILAGITSSDASQVEQARAVHTWMTRNISYAATIGLSGRYENVYQGLRHRSGNCFVYYYTAEIMLTRLGIPNRRIDRSGGETNHRWHLVNPDDMGWYHLDTSPHHVSVANQIDTFMFTSSQAAEYTQLIYTRLGRGNYYTYDKELHPDIVY